MNDLESFEDPDRVAPSATEVFYDTEIAPVLLALVKKCEERNIPFIASVEYAPDKVGRTFFLGHNPGLAMVMQHLCAASGKNLDGYFINLQRHVEEKGVDTSQSFVFNKLNAR